VNDQKRLTEIVFDLDARGCLIMMSNADTELIKNLYKRFNVVSLPFTRYITCKEKKHQVRELIITNYEVMS
jgi:DNA adenine methylase